MPKSKATLKITLPVWGGKGSAYEWRRKVLLRLNKESESSGANFARNALVEVDALVHMVRSRKGAEAHDVDNVLKHICDALQGRLGGPKNKRRRDRLIKNDRQVMKVTIEKKYLSKKNKSGGRLKVRPFKRRG
jgi:Holliday junction resolvase RusA-like endonuclease